MTDIALATAASVWDRCGMTILEFVALWTGIAIVVALLLGRLYASVRTSDD